MCPFLFKMKRYDKITEKNPREIVLLRGTGCQWKRCTFCDYHTDASSDANANFALNSAVLDCVTGELGRLEVINSGSFVDLDAKTMQKIRDVAIAKGISALHFECHWMHRGALNDLRAFFAKDRIRLIFKIGVESFDIPFRERILKKGLGNATPEQIAAAGFEEINLLCGIDGQTASGIRADIETGLAHFSRVCVNVMTENTTAVRPDKKVIEAFMREVYPLYQNDQRVDILLQNTDFGVGKRE